MQISCNADFFMQQFLVREKQQARVQMVEKMTT